MTEEAGSWGRREYEDYEELGRRLEALREALFALQGQVILMWDLGSGETEQTRHLAHDVRVLDMVYTLEQLHQDLALELAAEVDEKEVPEGKPRFPSPLDRRSP
jgi:hypothetical protein